MQLSTFTFVAVATITLALVNGRDNYLAERPAFFSICRQADPNFNDCFVNNIKKIFREWKDGVPGLKSLGTLDPLNVKRIGLAQDANNPLAQLDVDLLNAKIYGFSALEILDSDIDLKALTAKFKVRSPKFQIMSDYKIKGRVLNVDIDGTGKTDIKMDKIILNISISIKPRDEFGLTFIDVKKVRVNIEDVAGFHIVNEFDGSKELQESTNNLINQNWRDFVPVLSPTIGEAAEAVLTNRISKVFAYVPAKYLVEDFPSAAETSG